MDANRLIADLREMREQDQKTRFAANPTPGADNPEVREIDAANNRRIHGFIAAYGYPTQSLVGSDAMVDFWLIVQHQDEDLTLQEACLENCDFAPAEMAHLTDRVRVNRGEPQEYGTQLMRASDGSKASRPIRDPAGVATRRAAAGLEPLSEYLHRANTV